MFGVQSFTAFLFAVVVLGVTAAAFGTIAVKLVKGVTARDTNTVVAFGSITIGLMLGLFFHWSVVTATYTDVLTAAINLGNMLGAYEAFYLPAGFILLGVLLLTLRSKFNLGSAVRNRRF